MPGEQTAVQDSTPMWVFCGGRHIQGNPRLILAGELVLKLDGGWRRRPDMDSRATSLFRAAIVARARLIEDLVVNKPRRRPVPHPGNGLDTFGRR